MHERKCSTASASSHLINFNDMMIREMFRDLGVINTLLPVWIAVSMAVGVILGYFVPQVREKLDHARFADVPVPILVGMIWMMFPVLCKIDYSPSQFKRTNWKYVAALLVVNWVIAPFLMIGLGWATLPDLLEFRVGVIIVGTARCIAMVMIWNELAGGDQQLCATLVLINLLLQIALYGPLVYVYGKYLGGYDDMKLAIWPAIRSVLVFLGIPMAAGFVTRIGTKMLGIYDKTMKLIGPTSLLALLYVIIVLFALQGHAIVDNIGPVFRVVVPLLIYFLVLFTAVVLGCRHYCVPYPQMVTQAFTAASNNFELAIAVAGSIFGVDSKEAMAATVGPLVEVPVLVTLVYAIRWVNQTWYYKKINKCQGCDLQQVVLVHDLDAEEFNDKHKYRRFRAVTSALPDKNEPIVVLEKLNFRELELKLMKTH